MTTTQNEEMAGVFAAGQWGGGQGGFHPDPPKVTTVDVGKIPAHIPEPDFHHAFGFSTKDEAGMVAAMLAPYGVTGPDLPTYMGGFAPPSVGDYKQYSITAPNGVQHSVGLILRTLDVNPPQYGWYAVLQDVLGKVPTNA